MKTILAALVTAFTEYPAITGYLLDIALVLGARFGLHFTADEIVAVAGFLAAVVTAYIHTTVKPMARVRKDSASAP